MVASNGLPLSLDVHQNPVGVIKRMPANNNVGGESTRDAMAG